MYVICCLLQAEGFSEAIIDRFFRPFLGGIFFNTNLTTSSRLFEFVMRMLATGQNCLPAAGIGAMADQLAAKLPADIVYTGTAVVPNVLHCRIMSGYHALWQPAVHTYSREQGCIQQLFHAAVRLAMWVTLLLGAE